MNDAVLRLIDANANRAREALRVVEDYARFVLDDAELSGRVKQIRHDVAGAIGPLLDEAILHRDTPGDVGTTLSKKPSELRRRDVAHVVTAAGKRAGEALRAIEEYLKTIEPGWAANVERARYAFYDVEHRVALTLRPVKRFDDVRLCVLITESACAGRSPRDVLEQAIAGGADCIQLREKDLSDFEFYQCAKIFVDVCHRHGVMSIINDRLDIAILTGADGIHIGQGDLPVSKVRALLGPQKVIGVSTHEIAQARQARLDGADYIGVGPVFPSPTKPRGWNVLPGLNYAKQVAAELPDFPAFAIAGITLQNVDDVLATGMRRIAVTSAVTGAPDVTAAAKELSKKLCH